MTTSKSRPLWSDMPASARAAVEELAGGRVTRARSCPGGFSPGFASRLTLGTGLRVFVKAMDADTWPAQAAMHRAEAAVAAALPPEVPAPRLLGTVDDGHWTILAFEDVDGAEPAQPWRRDQLERVVVAVGAVPRTPPPSAAALPREHPRLGGWADLARDRRCLARLRERSPWAAHQLTRLVGLEEEGRAAARGDSLVHCDLYPHNILLTSERVVFVDWAHARLGAPLLDLISVLCSAAADGMDPEPFLRLAVAAVGATPAAVDAVLAAHAGFMLAGGLSSVPPGLEPIAAAKLRLGLGAVGWLERRTTFGGGAKNCGGPRRPQR